jgi:hypothetical protein
VAGAGGICLNIREDCEGWENGSGSGGGGSSKIELTAVNPEEIM